ncbi:hypothetical protein [Oscillospiraceae bacterium]|nr:hypothetical protein [Oscillospiraceae bacterium]
MGRNSHRSGTEIQIKWKNAQQCKENIYYLFPLKSWALI